MSTEKHPTTARGALWGGGVDENGRKTGGRMENQMTIGPVSLT